MILRKYFHVIYAYLNRPWLYFAKLCVETLKCQRGYAGGYGESLGANGQSACVHRLLLQKTSEL